MDLQEILGYYNYWVFAILLMIGLYTVIAKVNLIKKLIGLSVFQSAVFLPKRKICLGQDGKILQNQDLTLLLLSIYRPNCEPKE